MELPPASAKHTHFSVHEHLDLRKVRKHEPEILAQTTRPERAVQIEHRLMSATDHMHVRRAVVVRVNHEA
jgi:hypothetical protein